VFDNQCKQRVPPKKFLPKKSSQKIYPKKFLPKNSPKKFLQKNPWEKFTKNFKKIFQKIQKKIQNFFENIPFPTSHLEACFVCEEIRINSTKMGKMDDCIDVCGVLSITLSLILNFSVGISMIVVGEQYNEESSCKLNDIPKSLEILGGLILGVSIIYVLLTLGWYDKEESGKSLRPLILSIVLTQIAIMIWSSVVVFAPYKEWTSEDKESAYYCEYTPFNLLSVVLILKWIMLPLECFYYGALAKDFKIKLRFCVESA
jgi:hypothetical protein